ncbi:MAG: hypothetical protein E2O67_06830 [Deltaproteobacteria bacterium]|nr:MAG: hypothetical protein E2O67_06830 [Deltaproteobacteria bacterium]
MRTVFISLSLFLAFCSLGYPSDKINNTDHKTFGDYWYQGKAEITSYEMEQARYGEIRKGHAVLIFVTEDFSKSKQVKLDNPQKDPEDAVKILKLNFVRKFITGIYPYSIMTSVFTPVELSSHPNTLKLSFSSQEWCGNVHTQANHKKNRYEFNSYSYFESEGDAKFELEDAILEDELWTRIRISPDRLPVGNIKIIPSLLSSRLKHFELKVENAFAEKVVIDKKRDLVSYRVNYKNLDRKIQINFVNRFPYEIVEWSEEYKSGFGTNPKLLKTKGVKSKTLIIDYWNKNDIEDEDLRKVLGI